jgi:hypothetical protein
MREFAVISCAPASLCKEAPLSTIHGWLELNCKPEPLICRSRVHTLNEHFLDSHRRSCKCLGELCQLCNIYPQISSAVVAVTREHGARIQLLRITPAAWRDLCESGAIDQLEVGRILWCANLGSDRKEGLEIKLATRVPTREVPIARYVDAIGKKAYEQALGVLLDRKPVSLALAT